MTVIAAGSGGRLFKQKQRKILACFIARVWMMEWNDPCKENKHFIFIIPVQVIIFLLTTTIINGPFHIYFLTSCAILLISFGRKGPHLRDDSSHSPIIRRSPSWGFPGISSVVRQMPRDLCTSPRIISLSPLSLATYVTDVTFGASGLWLGTPTGAVGTATLA